MVVKMIIGFHLKIIDYKLQNQVPKSLDIITHVY